MSQASRRREKRVWWKKQRQATIAGSELARGLYQERQGSALSTGTTVSYEIGEPYANPRPLHPVPEEGRYVISKREDPPDFR